MAFKMPKWRLTIMKWNPVLDDNLCWTENSFFNKSQGFMKP